VADHFKGLFVTALDRNSSWWYAFLACSRWVGFRLDTLAAITLSFECILVMAVHQRVSLFTISPSTFAFCVHLIMYIIMYIFTGAVGL